MDAARSYGSIGYDDLGLYDKLQGKKKVGGRILEALRSSAFPNPPLTPSHNFVLFDKAASNLGYRSFSVPEPMPRVPTSIRTASSWTNVTSEHASTRT